MFGRHLHAPAIALTVLASASLGCVKTTQVGKFSLEVPSGWWSERDAEDPNTLGLGTKRVEWTWVMVTVPAGELGDKSLDEIGEGMADEMVEESEAEAEAHGGQAPAEDELKVEFGEPREWKAPGIEGIIMEGTMSDAQMSLNTKMLVLMSADEVMVAFGFRGPHAEGKHDAASDAMLQSIRAPQ